MYIESKRVANVFRQVTLGIAAIMSMSPSHTEDATTQLESASTESMSYILIRFHPSFLARKLILKNVETGENVSIRKALDNRCIYKRICISLQNIPAGDYVISSVEYSYSNMMTTGIGTPQQPYAFAVNTINYIGDWYDIKEKGKPLQFGFEYDPETIDIASKAFSEKQSAMPIYALSPGVKKKIKNASVTDIVGNR